ncbi:MAG TPA: GxxExxY protein [Pyrinomonadaceae bacterium]|nr:GxxExxY protein [Pyrinomonadaceae bacterium]
MTELVLREEVYEIIGAALEVYWKLGAGLAEPIYQEALGIELTNRGLPFKAQHELRIWYKEHLLEKRYFPDFVCFNSIIVELKSLVRLTPTEESQLLNYMRITKMRVGLLINFGGRPKLEWKRYVV